MTIVEQRKRVLAVISIQMTSEILTGEDYILDDIARRLLRLPALPAGDKPYEGWLTIKPKDAEPPTRTSKTGIELIKKFEGCRTNAYKCPAGVWTIGYGHTASAHEGMMISHLQAEKLLAEDLKRFEKAVSDYVTVPLTQNQFDALVSFAYNVGAEAFRRSTLLVRVNANQLYAAAKQFRRWTKGGRLELPGLVRRRNEEEALFLKS